LTYQIKRWFKKVDILILTDLEERRGFPLLAGSPELGLAFFLAGLNRIKNNTP
jgi:hypothetical protein